MPFIRNTVEPSGNVQDDPIIPGSGPGKLEVGFFDALAPAFRLDSMMAVGGDALRESLITRTGTFEELERGDLDAYWVSPRGLITPESFPCEKGYTIFNDPQMEGNEDLISGMLGVCSSGEARAIIAHSRAEQLDYQLLELAGGYGFAATMLASVLSPITVLPFGPASKAATALGAVVKGGGTFAVLTGIEEGIFQHAQELRTLAQSGIAISTAAIFGGLFGNLARVYGRDVLTKFGKDFDDQLRPSEAAFNAQRPDINPPAQRAPPGNVDDAVATTRAEVIRARMNELTDRMPDTDNLKINDPDLVELSKLGDELFSLENPSLPEFLSVTSSISEIIIAAKNMVSSIRNVAKTNKNVTAADIAPMESIQKSLEEINSTLGKATKDRPSVNSNKIVELVSKAKIKIKSILDVSMLASGKAIDEFEVLTQALKNIDIYLDAVKSKKADDFLAAQDGEIIDPSAPTKPRGAGAEASPNADARSYNERLDAEGLKETLIHLERFGLNPILRLLRSPDLQVRELASQIAGLPGLIQNKVRSGFHPTDDAAEINWRREWLPNLFETIEQVDEIYASYRGRAGEGRVRRLGMALSDLMASGRNKGTLPDGSLTHTQFREQVGIALINGDKHAIAEVAAAAKVYRDRIFNPLKEAGEETGIFTIELKNRLADIEEEIGNAVSTKATARLKALREEKKAVQKKIDKIERDGIESASGILSFRPRIYRHDIIHERREQFKGMILEHLEETDLPIRKREQASEEIIERILQERPYQIIDDDRIRIAGSARSRGLDIEDNFVSKAGIAFSDFLENDAEALARFYVRSFGQDVELVRKFGSITLKDKMDVIKANAVAMRKVATTTKERKAIDDRLKEDIDDIKALRDRVRGTYGLPDDPYRQLSRFYRVMKQWSYLTSLGGVVISALPDLGRLAMTEGLSRTFDHSIKGLFRNMDAIKMSAREVKLSGTALDMVLQTRALQFADIGDIFGRRTAFERSLSTSTGIFSMVNLLNPWNASMKQWAGIVVSSRILETSIRLARKHGAQIDTNLVPGGSRISQGDIEKLGRGGIGALEAERIGKMFAKYGQVEDGVFLPNTAMWDDVIAVKFFRNALQQDVDRIIVTPGAADRPLWASTELGSVIAQFKSFGMAAHSRVLIAGLQERDLTTISGALLMFALGATVDSIKRYQFGDNRKLATKEQIMRAVDRSGLLGFIPDANSALEKLTDNRLGFSFLIGLEKPYKPSFKTKAGVIGGPTGQMIARMIDIAGDVGTANMDRYTVNNIRRLLPSQNLIGLQHAFDAVEKSF